MTNTPRNSSAPLLDIRDLRTHFFTRRGVVPAVNGVSFAVDVFGSKVEWEAVGDFQSR